MTFEKKDRPYRYTSPTLPGFGRVGPWSTGATSKRLADAIESWLRQTALADPTAVQGIVDGKYSLTEAYVAHQRGGLEELKDAITNPPLANLVDRYERTLNDRRKIEGLAQLLELAPAKCQSSWLTSQNITDILTQAAKDRKVNSVHRSLYAAIKGLLAYHLGEARKRAICADVKFRHVDDTRHVDVTAADMARLLSHCDAEMYDLTVAAVLTGIDQGPLLRLHRGSFDWERQTVRVEDTKNRARQRTIELSDAAAAHFRVLVNNTPKDRPLFRLTGTQAQRRWRAARIEAGLTVRFKDLRHVFANAWVDEGGSLKDLGSILGHTRAATTLRYTARQKAEAKDRMQRVAERLGLKNQHVRAG